MKILNDAEIRFAARKAMEEGQLYGDDGKPLPEKAVAQAQLNSDRKEVILELQGILDDNVSDQDKLNQVANFIERLKPKEARANETKLRLCFSCLPQLSGRVLHRLRGEGALHQRE